MPPAGQAWQIEAESEHSHRLDDPHVCVRVGARAWSLRVRLCATVPAGKTTFPHRSMNGRTVGQSQAEPHRSPSARPSLVPLAPRQAGPLVPHAREGGTRILMRNKRDAATVQAAGGRGRHGMDASRPAPSCRGVHVAPAHHRRWLKRRAMARRRMRARAGWRTGRASHDTVLNITVYVKATEHDISAGCSRLICRSLRALRDTGTSSESWTHRLSTIDTTF